MNKYFHKILTFLSFLIPLFIYIFTMAPTTSFWDCGEFISTSYIMGVPHPPGSPLYLLLGNFFSSISIFEDIGARVTLISPIVSALSVMFLYLIIVYLIKEYKGESSKISDILIVHSSAFIASITFAVTDSQWFNAVEAEVYSISTFLTSIVVWMILKWSKESLTNWNIKYLLIIIYMFGLATGLHLLNLLTLPFVSLIIFFRKFKVSVLKFFLTMILTGLSFIIIYIGIIKGIPNITSKLNSTLFLMVFLLSIISSLVLIRISFFNYSYRLFAYLSSSISIFFVVILIINSFLIMDANQISLSKQTVLIDKQELIDQYDKEIYKLNNSISPDQLYHDRNLQRDINAKIESRNNFVDEFRILYEDYFNFEKNKDNLNFLGLLKWQPKFNIYSILIILIVLAVVLFRFKHVNNQNYNQLITIIFSGILLILIGFSTYTTIFIRAGQHPAINENNPDNIDRALAYMNRDQYGDWDILNLASTLGRTENTNWKRYTLNKNNPTKVEQINFFIKYQINEMYLRYFAWQFIGRGDKNHHPWYIYDLNGNLIGNQKLDGIDIFRYGLPLAFIFGIIGLIFHFTNDWKRALAVLSLFLATGFMIILYLNQYDPQPRERDYSYVGSFFAFSIWIGIGLFTFLDKIKKYFIHKKLSIYIPILICVIIFIAMPVKMLAADYKEHDRSKNYVAWDYGYNLLNSCEPHGIIFTNGDNDTFPLWYLQEVEGIRKDVKVVNLSLLNTPWYIEQLINQEPSLDLSFNHPDIKENIDNLDPYIATEAAFDICNYNYEEDQNWDNINCNLFINENVLNFNVSPTLIGKLLRVQDYMILKIINDIGKNKPIYFAATVSERNQIGLSNYLLMEGMTYRLKFKPINSPINYSKMKKNLIESNNLNIIRTTQDYNKIINTNNSGIYRYTNLNDTTIHYSDNIKRLVQNYRIGFIRLAQYELSLENENKIERAETYMNLMNQYFPEISLPIEPGISILISDSIYAKTGNVKKQTAILKKLFYDNSLPIETKIYLLHKFSEVNSQENIVKMAEFLIDNFHEYLDFDLEKYLGDILSDYLEQEKFISFCDSILSIYPLKGMLYSQVRVLEEMNYTSKAFEIIENWLDKNPNDQDLIRLYNYLIDVQSIK